MNTIKINASNKYAVLVGKGLLAQIGEHLKNLSKDSRPVIISDSNVWPLYGKIVKDAFVDFGYTNIFSYVIPAGEQSKNIIVFCNILDYLSSNHISRADCIIALGGGVVGDLSGFVASCYLRGISYIQLPTSLIACVDSSVGGKTGIDLNCGKNLVGSFYHPKAVFCDIDTLSTLPEQHFQDGCAEIIKYALLYDPELFSHLAKHVLSFDREWVISRCITLKRNAVEEDEFDQGVRQMLNLGHTIGHSLEVASCFTLSHGRAVAIGISIITRAATAKGFCDPGTRDAVIALLEAFNLPTTTSISLKSIYENSFSDKKCSHNAINLIVPNKIGQCSIIRIGMLEFKEFIEAGL